MIPSCIMTAGMAWCQKGAWSLRSKSLWKSSKTGNVTLDILDLSGRRMSRIMKNVQNPGRQVLEVDGSGWPSGVYLAVLRFGRMSATRKLVLVR